MGGRAADVEGSSGQSRWPRLRDHNRGAEGDADRRLQLHAALHRALATHRTRRTRMARIRWPGSRVVGVVPGRGDGETDAGSVDTRVYLRPCSLIPRRKKCCATTHANSAGSVAITAAAI